MMKSERGFTLVEVLASITILFIILISFLTIFAQSATFTRTNEGSLQATNLADRIMEILRGSKDVDELSSRLMIDFEAEYQIVEQQTSEGDIRLYRVYQFTSNEDDVLFVSVGLPLSESLEFKTDFGLVPAKIEIIHTESENVLATRHFYVRE